MRDLARFELFLASIICFVVFAWVRQEYSRTETTKTYKTTVGYSPWFVLVQSSTEQEEGMSFNTSLSSEWKVALSSPSWLFLLAALWLLSAARKRRPDATPAAKTNGVTDQEKETPP